MKWKYLGTIQEAKKSGCSGVYLIVHQGKYNRVVYVGVSVNIGRRMAEHYEGYCRGNRTIYNVNKDEDVYTLMTSYMIHNHIREYKKLAREKKIWASTTLYDYSPTNLLSAKQVFDHDWESVVHDKYLPRLCAWALPVSNYTYDIATKIESIIQLRLINNFDLRGFFNVDNISMLGKVEHPKIKRYDVDFECLPDLDDASKIIIDSLDSLTVPPNVWPIARKQLSEVTSMRFKLKMKAVRERDLLSVRYKNRGLPWTKESLEKLRVMLVEFDMKPSEISKYLHRSPQSIAMKIDYNDKFTNRMWRKNIKWL
mgnify:CR=1 FL=1